MVLLGCLVQFYIINAHILGINSLFVFFIIVIPPLLRHNMDQTYPLTIGDRVDNTDLKQFQNFFPDHVLHIIVQPSLVFN